MRHYVCCSYGNRHVPSACNCICGITCCQLLRRHLTMRSSRSRFVPQSTLQIQLAMCFAPLRASRSEEHTSEIQSLTRISYAVFCLKKKKNIQDHNNNVLHLTVTIQ